MIIVFSIPLIHMLSSSTPLQSHMLTLDVLISNNEMRNIVGFEIVETMMQSFLDCYINPHSTIKIVSRSSCDHLVRETHKHKHADRIGSVVLRHSYSLFKSVNIIWCNEVIHKIQIKYEYSQ